MRNLTQKALLAAFALVSSTVFVQGQVVTGYFDNSLNQAGTRITQLHWNKMTDFIFGFIQPDGSGNLPDPTTLNHFNTAKSYCQSNNVKMHFSSGGATYSSIFNTIGNSASASANFAKEIADILETHGLVGFDLDWEFPRTQAEQVAQVNILKAVHDEFTARGKRAQWEIAIAVGGETPSVGAQGVYHTDYCSPNAFQYIDKLNIMSYDIGYNISGGDPNHSSYADAQANVTDWVAKGCPIEKIVLGVPFYARHSSNRGAAIYTHAYSDLSNSNPSAAFNSDNVGAYYYNGKATLEQKVNYIMQQGGAGVMIWEVTYDRFDQYSLLDVLADAMSPYQCSAPKPDLGADQSICGVGSITLDGGVARAAGRTFTWKKGGVALVTGSATANTYNATSTGTYTLEVNENGCFQSDEIVITGTLNAIDLGGPYELCSPVSVTLNTNVSGGGKTFEWLKDNVTIAGATTSTYTAKRAGTYKVIVSASGCAAVQATATVTSKAPYADNDTVCKAGDQASLTASESVNWYSSEVSSTILATGTTYTPTVSGNTTFWMGGTGAQATQHTTMKSAFAGGWQANSQVYGSKLTVLQDLTIDAVTLNPGGGTVTINLVESNGTTVVHTKSFGSTSGEQEFNLGWSVTAGTYYMNLVGTSGTVWVDPTQDASNYSVAGVITVDKNCYEDWSAPYGNGYQASTNYGNFIKLKVTVGSACDRVPVDVIVDGTNPSCNVTGLTAVGGNTVAIYPNPSQDQFALELSESAVVAVFGTSGNLLSTFPARSGVTNFGDQLSAGVYFVQVSLADGTKTIKIVKQ